MAEVWIATDTLLTRQVAVKLLKPNLAADRVVAERFRREAIAVAQLSHPNIVAVYDAIGDNIGGQHRQAVVMQLIAGKSLRQYLDEQRKLSPDLTIHIGNCVANALDAAHRAGLVHRDVKPGNILITPDGRVLLTDFGIAKGVSDTEDLTNDNVMMGTAKYLSPEQVRGRKLDGRADLYSLGLVLYECLAGRVPFLGESDAETALARLNRDPTDINRLRSTLPEGLGDVVHRLLARRPEDRFESGAAVRLALSALAPRAADAAAHAPTPAAGQPVTRPPRVGGSPASPVQRPRARRSAERGTRRPSDAAPGRNDQPRIDPPRIDPLHIDPLRAAQARADAVRTTGSTPAVVGPLIQPPIRGPRGTAVTPHNPNRPDPRPNRHYAPDNRRATLLVAGLIITAIVMVIVILATLGEDPNRERLPTIPAADAATRTQQPAGNTEPARTPPPPVPDGAPVIMLFDPDGDGTENAQVEAAFDGDSSTMWSTECYRSSQLGGKRGVGLLIDLGSDQTGTLDATIASAPFGVQILASADGDVPSRIQDMTIIKRFQRDQRGTITATLDTPARYVAVVFVKLARDSECTGRRFRGDIAEVQWTKG